MTSKNQKPDEKQVQNLIKKAITHDEQAFGEVYDVYFEKIYRFIYFRVSHKETAEDLVSQTFIKVWDGIDDLESHSSFNGWIYQIARNLVIDHYRTRKSTANLEILENVLEYEDNIVHKTNLEYDMKKILELLDELSEDQRQVVRMKFIEDLENEEIAAALNKSEGTVRVIQHRALNQLKELINKQEDE